MTNFCRDDKVWFRPEKAAMKTKLTRDDKSQWETVSIDKVSFYRSSVGGNLTVSISQKRYIAKSIAFKTSPEGHWVLDAYVNGKLLLDHVHLEDDTPVVLNFGGFEDAQNLKVIFQLTPIEMECDPNRSPQRIKLPQEVDLERNASDLIWRRCIAFTVIAIALVYLAICLGQLLTKLPLLNELGGYVQAVMTLLGFGIAWTPYLQTSVHFVARRTKFLAVAACVAAVLTSMLWDFAAYQVSKRTYISSVSELAQDVGAATLGDITELMRDFPHRPEAYILSEAASFVAPLGTTPDDVAPGNEDRETIRSHFRAVFEITGAFSGDKVTDQHAIERRLEALCSHPDSTSAPIKFVSVFVPTSLIGLFDGTHKEVSVGCEFAIERLRAAFTELTESPPSEALKLWFKLTANYEPAVQANAMFGPYSEMQLRFHKPCDMDGKGIFDGPACVHEFEAARSVFINQLRDYDPKQTAHSTQFFHSDLAYTGAQICQKMTQQNQNLSEIQALVGDSIEMVVRIRESKRQDQLGIWPAPPSRLSMYLALTGEQGAVQYARGKHPASVLRECFGTDLKLLWSTLNLPADSELPNMRSWWRRGSIEAFREGNESNTDKLNEMVNTFTATGWRL